MEKDQEYFSAYVCLRSSVSSTEVLVLLVLNLRIESGCPKGEDQFALQDMFHFPRVSNKEAIWLGVFTCKSPDLHQESAKVM